MKMYAFSNLTLFFQLSSHFLTHILFQLLTLAEHLVDVLAVFSFISRILHIGTFLDAVLMRSLKLPVMRFRPLRLVQDNRGAKQNKNHCLFICSHFACELSVLSCGQIKVDPCNKTGRR